MHKFRLIFHTLVQTINSDEPQEETDRFITDTILQIVNVILGLLKNNIDSLNLPAALKSALQKLKGLIIWQTKDSEESKPGDPQPENAQNTSETEGVSKASRGGGERRAMNE